MFGNKTEITVDSTLNKWRPTLTRGPNGQWQLTVEVRDDVFVRAEFKNSRMLTALAVGRTIHAVKPKNMQRLSNQYEVPLLEISTALVERWRFLNLIVELYNGS